MTDPSPDLDRAAAAARGGDLVVYPTETVYGLGALATDPDAVERVFETKRRARDEPVSLAVPRVDDVDGYARLTDRERTFCREFLPGPVTVLLERRQNVPDVLVAGRDRVGVRVPDHPVALDLLDRVAPLTATSANVSGRPSARRAADVDPEVREAAVVVDGGETPGGGSTVVNVETGELVREGALADDVRAWLQKRA